MLSIQMFFVSHGVGKVFFAAQRPHSIAHPASTTFREVKGTSKAARASQLAEQSWDAMLTGSVVDPVMTSETPVPATD